MIALLHRTLKVREVIPVYILLTHYLYYLFQVFYFFSIFDSFVNIVGCKKVFFSTWADFIKFRRIFCRKARIKMFSY